MASQAKEMDVKKGSVLTYTTEKRLPKLARILVHLSHFLRVAASYTVVVQQGRSSLLKNTESVVASALITWLCTAVNISGTLTKGKI